MVKVDHAAVLQELLDSLNRVQVAPVTSCPVSPAINSVLEGKECLTYQYILLTALAAKAAEPAIDPLSLKVKDASPGAYAPRTLCSKVVYPFQKEHLGNVLNGANNDPLVNKPGRFKRLTCDNESKGDGRAALEDLVTHLPKVKTATDARLCLDCFMTRLVDMKKKMEEEATKVAERSVSVSSPAELRRFLSDLLDQGFGGDALTLVASALYRIQYPEADGYRVVPHPVNQSGASGRQRSDLDLERNGSPFLGTELKDKEFTQDDVRRAADTAKLRGLSALLFVSGRGGRLSDQLRTYFAQAKAIYAAQGMFVGVCGIDDLMDIVLSTHQDVDAPVAVRGVYSLARENGSTAETLLWISKRLSGK